MKKGPILLLPIFLALAVQAAAFFLWLDAPKGRTNPNDPKSSFFVEPSPTSKDDARGRIMVVATPAPVPGSSI